MTYGFVHRHAGQGLIPRRRAWRCAWVAGLVLWGNAARADIQHVANGFLFTGTNSSVLISDTNGSILSVKVGGNEISTGGEVGLWSVAYTNFSTDIAGSLATPGSLSAAAFSSGSSSNTFQWSLPSPSNVLYLTYSNADLTVAVALSNRTDGVDMSAQVSSRNQTVLGLSLPGRLRFDPDIAERFIAPSHTSDSVGWELAPDFFQAQPSNTPAHWTQATVGPQPYIDLYGGPLVFTNYDAVPITFTAEGTNWLGAGVAGAWAGASAPCHRPPAAGQYDVVLINSAYGPFFSGSRLGGGANAGYLMRIGGYINGATSIRLSTNIVLAALEHLAQSAPPGRTNVALLWMERGPVIGYNWPSAVKHDQWLQALTNSTVLAANGIEIILLTKAEAMLGALAATNYLAILNPYGELIPTTLGGSVSATVSNVGDYVQAGGNWFEAGGHPFYQALSPSPYYSYNVAYPPVFADFLHLETTNGNASLFGVQPVQTHPTNAWATNSGALFVPGQLAWGGDTNAAGGYFERAFGTHVASNQTWQSPTVRLALGQTATNSLQSYVQANGLTRGLTNKVTNSSLLDSFKRSILIHYGIRGEDSVGVCTQLTARLPDLPTPAVLHITQYLYGGFDKMYPDHLPPNTNHWGTTAEFTNFLAQAKARGLLTMPYTNPTFWGEYPRGPWFTANGEDGLQRNLTNGITLEDYFGNAGYTVTPWHPEVQAANTNTVHQFLTDYPVDILFEDQIGARTWIYDLNPASPTPYAYMAGNTARAAEDSVKIPLSTENGYDRLANFEAQFCGLAWAIVPTPGAPDWRRFLTDRYLASTWRVFPVAQYIAHDKVLMNYNDLSATVDRHEVLAWTLGLGYGTTYRLYAPDLDIVAQRQWLLWVDRIQKSVCARYIGGGAKSFSHQWGSNVLHSVFTNGVVPADSQPVPDHGVITAGYGDVSVTANLGPNQLTTNGVTLASYGYLATAPGLVAAHRIPPGGANAAPYVAETNAGGGLDFWIYSKGSTNATIVLPSGFNGTATVQVDGFPAVQTQVVDNVLTVALGSGATTNAYLWHGTLSSGSGKVLLVDFGRHDGGVNGTATASPDVNGNYWNNIGPTIQDVTNGTKLLNLVTVTNGATGIGVETTTDTWDCNGRLNGGLTNSPQSSLGRLAIVTATEDYFFTTTSGSFKLTGLDTNRTYDLTFFGTRATNQTRITRYTVGSGSTNLMTSGLGSGVVAPNQNDATTAVLRALAPSAAGEISITVSTNGGGFAYLGCLQIEEILPAPPAAAGIAISPDSLNFSCTNGANPASQTFSLTNVGTATLNYSIATNAGWLSVSSPTGALAPGAGQLVTVSVNAVGLQVGTSNATVTISDAAATNSPQTVSVMLQIQDSDLRVLVFGSSVANGWNGGGIITNGSYAGGYAGLLTTFMDPTPWTVTNSSVPGNNTTLALARFDTDAVPVNPDVIVIGLSLANEGLTTNPDSEAVFESFRSGMTNLIHRSRTNGFYPGVTLVYPNNNYLSNHYAYVKRMNLLMNTWDVPSVNMLGALDNGQGGWVNGYWSDALHPNTAGHQEMFYAIVPSLFDAIVSGKTNPPILTGTHGFARLEGTNAQPLAFTPSNTMHSFNLALRVRTTATGTVAAVVTSTGSPPAAAATILVDFGPNDVTNGDSTPSPDYLGQYWNNFIGTGGGGGLAALNLSNLITTNNTPTTIGLISSASGWAANGKLNGGLLTPSYALLGDFAVTNATEDYFHTTSSASITITNLDPAATYSLRLFGTRNITSNRVTRYVVTGGNGSFTNDLTTSGTGIGSGGYNGNNDTIVSVAGITPDASRNIQVTLTPQMAAPNNFAYLGILEIKQEATTSSSPQGGTLEIRDNQLAYVAKNGSEITAAVDANDGGWIDVALSHSYARETTLLYVDGVLAGSVSESLPPVKFVLGSAGGITNRAAGAVPADFQDWCVYRAPWTPDEALAQHTGALQQASMEIGAPLNDPSFPQGGSASNRAQSLSQALIGGTNLVAGTVVLPPTSLQAVAIATNTVRLTWTDNSTTETGFVLERRPAGGGHYWSNVVTLASGVTGYTNTGVAGGTYEYRVSSQEGSLQSDYSGIAMVTVSNAVLTPIQAILVDFGNSNSYNGVSVANPDGNGNHWNSVYSGAYYANMVDTSNQATTVDLGFDYAQGTDNFNGPGGVVDAAALGVLGGATNAVNDYYVSSRFRIQGLDTGRVYRLTFFGSHKYSPATTTVYSVYADTNYSSLVTSASLNVQVPGSPQLHNSNTVAVISNLAPQALNSLFVKFEGSTGTNGYLNAMMIEAFNRTCPTITLSPAVLSYGISNVTYNAQTLTATGGVASYTYALASGSLPAGLTLTAGGMITGTPTSAVGTYSFAVTATDANGCTGMRSYSIDIQARAFAVTPYAAAAPFTLDTNTANCSVSGSVNLANSPGLGITTAGALYPAPVAVYQNERWGASTYTFSGLTAGADYNVRLHFAELWFGPAPLGGGGGAGSRVFNVTLNGANYLTNFDIFAAAGNVSTTAVIRETTVTANGSGQISVGLVNGTADNAKIDGIEILQVSSCTLTPASQTVSGSTNICSGGTATVALSGSESGVIYELYAGTSLADTWTGDGNAKNWGVSPAATTTYTVKTARSGNYCAATMSGSATVTVFALSPSVLPRATVNQAYNTSLAVSGGTAPYTFTIISNSLPAGLGMTSAGAITGTPTTVGTTNFTVSVLENNGCTASRTISLAVTPPMLAIYGTSVAKGWNSSGHYADPDVFVDGGSWSNGYAALITTLLAGQGGPIVTNVSEPGKNTAWGLDNFNVRVSSQNPNYVLLGYSTGNEGLAGTTDPTSSNIVATFTANLSNLVVKCRTNGFYPVISSVYPNGGYTLANYEHLKRMHLVINSWNVPSLNLMTPVDDGAGKWLSGYTTDAAHPNDAGYAEFFYAFVPSLFDAIASGKTNSPQFGASTNFARLTAAAGNHAPLTFTPSHMVHSFTLAFRMRTLATGTVAAVRSGSSYSTLEVRSNQLVYVDRSGAETVIAVNLADGAWHDVALSSRHALSNTAVYVDGSLAGSVPERYEPDQFILGGPAASGRAPTPALMDLRNWCVYRAGWTVDEAAAQKNGNLQQSSMEIGAMLDDAAFASNSPAANRAQSLSIALVNTPNLAATNGLTLAAPGNVTAQVAAGRTIRVGWTWSGSGQSGFVIQRRLAGTGTWSDLATVGAGTTNYIDSGLTWGAVYEYQVAAYESVGFRGDYGAAGPVLLVDSSHSTFLVDFGPNDVTNGDATGNPDFLGQHWNNLVGTAGGSANSIMLANLTNTTGTASGIGLSSGPSGWSCNGKLNGALLAPSVGLLGNLAVTNATEDYFYTGGTSTLTLTNMDAAVQYRFRFFGSRIQAGGTNDVRISRYVVTGQNGSFTNELQTTGYGIGAGGYNGNNSNIVAVTGVLPDPSGQIQIQVSSVGSTVNAYINILEIQANHAPAASNDVFARYAHQPLTITAGQLLANDTDADGDNLVLVEFSSLPAGASTNAASISLPATNAPVTFNYTIQDGFGGTAAGTATVNISPPPAAPVIQGLAREGNDIRVTWSGPGGFTNQVQAAPGGAQGAFADNFADLGGAIVLPGSGTVTTNYLEVGGGTNSPGRYFRVRLAY